MADPQVDQFEFTFFGETTGTFDSHMKRMYEIIAPKMKELVSDGSEWETAHVVHTLDNGRMQTIWVYRRRDP